MRLCIEKGLVTGKKVMIDGSLIKADAALSSLTPKEFEKEDEPKDPDDSNSNVTRIKEHKSANTSKNIKGKKLSNETHISKTDPDCTLAGKAGEPKQLRYKEHCPIDRNSRVILDAHITTGAEVDGHQMLGRLDYLEETFGFDIEEATADRGYGYESISTGLKKETFALLFQISMRT